jgi:dihydrofolate reductase
MRKVVVYELISVDGIGESPEEFVLDWDAEMEANLAEVISTQDTVILGRRIFDEWSNFWPKSEMQPFANFINSVEKFIATSTPLVNSWSNSHRIEGELIEFIRELKLRNGGDIGVHASMSVVHDLLTAGVVDELHLVITPRIAGKGSGLGRKLLDNLPTIPLTLVKSETSSTGAILVSYQVGLNEVNNIVE